MSAPAYNQFCALSRATEILGERWTLLIVREQMLGPKRFVDLSERLQGISPTLLTARLAALAEQGLIRRAAHGGLANVSVYELTPLGARLQPVVRELIRWGGNFLMPMRAEDAVEPDWILLGLDSIARRRPTPAARIGLDLRQKGKAMSFLVEGGSDGARVTWRSEDAAPEAVVDATFDAAMKIISGKLTIDEQIEAGRARLDGSRRAARLLPKLFEFPL